MNDILKCFQDNNIYMYADDMLIIPQHESIYVMCQAMQNKPYLVTKWCRHNKLTVNINNTKFKCQSISFQPKGKQRKCPVDNC